MIMTDPPMRAITLNYFPQSYIIPGGSGVAHILGHATSSELGVESGVRGN